jgi:hypothetical protein
MPPEVFHGYGVWDGLKRGKTRAVLGEGHR